MIHFISSTLEYQLWKITPTSTVQLPFISMEHMLQGRFSSKVSFNRNAWTLWYIPRAANRSCLGQLISQVSRAKEVFVINFKTSFLLDDESHLDDIASCEHLGELKIIINRVIFPTIVKTRPVTDIPRGEVGRIHEQAKKSLTHQVTLVFPLPDWSP